jgi:hypothetical protein
LAKARDYLLEANRREPNNPRIADSLGKVTWLLQPGNANKEAMAEPLFSTVAGFSFRRDGKDTQ